MKKASVKGKATQASKGCQKISNFFTKKADSSLSQVTKSPKKTTNTAEIYVLDSDEEVTRKTPTLFSTKRKFESTKEQKMSPPLKKGPSAATNSKIEISPVPSTSGMTRTEKKSCIFVDDVENFVQPSLSETPVKNSPLIAVKNVEKLLSPVALKYFNSPEQVRERILERTVLTPQKFSFGDEEIQRSSPRSSSQIVEKTTPQKNKIISKLSGSSSGNSSSEKNSSRGKRTPKKLFEKSPEKLNTFNVEVLKNFVKITPSKSNPRLEVERNYHNRSQEVQIENEKTPIKAILPSMSVFDAETQPLLKVRAKLDFSNCDKNKNISSDTHCDITKTNEEKQISAKNNAVKNEVLCSPQIKNLSPSGNSEEKENFDLNGMDDFDFEDDSWDAQIFEQTNFNLNLAESQHCKIVGLTQRQSEIELTLKSTKTNEQAVCRVQGFWIHSRLCIGDTLHLSAKKVGENDWLIDNQNGCIVYEPDLLVSTTSVTGSLFCKRKCLFNEKFKGFEGTNKFMLLGCLIHDIMQEVLKRKMRNLLEIEACARSMLASPTTVRRIYESEVTLEYLEKEIVHYLPKIAHFIDTYIESDEPSINPKKVKKGNWEGTINSISGLGVEAKSRELGKNKSREVKKGDWQGVITAIEDIEENIWSPDLGVKGKIDVSVKSGLATMPLEVKTGRASCSVEHRAQVLLYIMMMNKFGYNVPSGLLLYIKEGVLKEITSNQAEKRDIILLRNELAYYLKQEPRLVKDGEHKKFVPIKLPEPIDNDFDACSKCPHNVLCASYSRYTNEDLSSKKKIQSLQTTLLDELVLINDSHIEYFMHWNGLLHLEMNQGKRKQKQLRDIYTLPANERKTKGKCLIDLKLAYVGPELNGTHETTFESEHKDGKNVNFMTSGLQENNYVVISTEIRPAVASGFVTDIKAQKITISIDRNLSKKYQNSAFFVDTYESSVFLTYNLSSLYLILDPSAGGQKLRNIIIDREPPRFFDKLPKVVAEKGKAILRRLNRVQQRAVLKAIAAEDYMLIKGMPGTGKTATIVALIQLLVEMEKTILITSHTHSAVDNVCLKLDKLGVKVMRLGSEAKMHRNLKECSEHFLTKDCRTPEDLDAVYNSAQVLAVTCFGSGHPVLSKRTVDICIVDESTQVLQCSVLRPLSVARTFILIGDPDQLPAVVKSTEAIEMGMTESLFERLNTDDARITLNLNYRMNEPITALANALTYNGELLIGSDLVAKATLKIPRIQVINAMDKWITKALNPSLESAVLFLDTGPIWNLDDKVDWKVIDHSLDDELSERQQVVNIYEAAVVFQLVQALIQAGVAPALIGVIATYRSQVNQIMKILEHTRVEISTVDQYQGKDKSIIIYSCSKSQDMSKECKSRKFELLEDKRRLNVAITRAKHKLIIVGDFLTLRKYTTFSKISSILEKNAIKLTKCESFSWESVLKVDR